MFGCAAACRPPPRPLAPPDSRDPEVDNRLPSPPWATLWVLPHLQDGVSTAHSPSRNADREAAGCGLARPQGAQSRAEGRGLGPDVLLDIPSPRT